MSVGIKCLYSIIQWRIHSVAMKTKLWSLIFLSVLADFIFADPLVTLKHGGQYEGKSITFNGTKVDLFLGKLIW